MSGPRPVVAPRGTQLSCANWQIEAPYRMLQNNLDPDVAERPDDLVVYGGTGRAARSWDAYDAMLRTMQTMKPDETMLVQSGKQLVCSVLTNGRHACCWRTPTWWATGQHGTSSVA